MSLADLIVLGGCAAVEKAARNAGHDVTVPFTPGRTDASQEQTDVESFSRLEPAADGFRNYAEGEVRRDGGGAAGRSGAAADADRSRDDGPGRRHACPERQLRRQSQHGVFTERPEALTNDFFVNLLDMGTTWTATSEDEDEFEGRDRATGELRWTGTRVDLIFGSNSQLRALAEVYGCEDSEEKFVHDFVEAWDKVMNLDRFDLA